MVTREQVEHIAKLARIELTDSELEKFQKDFSSILDYFEVLKNLDTSNESPLTHAVLLSNVAREDVAKDPDIDLAQELLDMAPTQDQGFIQVKEVWKRTP
ncbi:MAG: Asp-tRNA(Asn)/Glu-tRNA(Gln) amidotransferase subunit GatC [Parcubacteria group bacterium]|nr:Asp-tRNA(Asn)/Glu-tRNA(Gln) amidotransferase subunit GatC [Parcubacteria group bacterium]